MFTPTATSSPSNQCKQNKIWPLQELQNNGHLEKKNHHQLRKLETESSFYVVVGSKLCSFFSRGSSGSKSTKVQPKYSFNDDDKSVPEAKQLTVQQKVTFLKLMCRQIANYCPIISQCSLLFNRLHQYYWKHLEHNSFTYLLTSYRCPLPQLHLSLARVQWAPWRFIPSPKL